MADFIGLITDVLDISFTVGTVSLTLGAVADADMNKTQIHNITPTTINIYDGVSRNTYTIQDTLSGLNLFTTDGDSTTITAAVQAIIQSQTVELNAQTKLNVRTPGVNATTATTGQVLTLIDPMTGESEFQSSGGVLSFVGTVDIPSSYEYIFTVTDPEIITSSILTVHVYTNVNEENEDEDVLIKIKNMSSVTPNTAEEGLIKAFSKTKLRKKVIWYLEGLVFN